MNTNDFTLEVAFNRVSKIEGHKITISTLVIVNDEIKKLFLVWTRG